MRVNAETLHFKIKYLERCKVTPGLGISLNEEYQLEAYKMLLRFLEIEAECKHVWIVERVKVSSDGVYRRQKRCNICGVLA